MACPGSVRLSRQVPIPPSTSFAQDGTRAHALAELCLRDGPRPTRSRDYWLGLGLEDGEVTEEMIEAVGVYLDHCQEIMRRPGVKWWIERRFTLAALNPPVPMFGTSDFVAYEPETQTLHVSDLKYGQGVVVEVVGSKQLRYYALGALLSFDDRRAEMPVRNVSMTIVQPRALHADGAVRSEEIGVEELLGFASDLLAAAQLTQEPDAKLVAGSHCRFCPAAGVCPKQLEQAQALAQMEFSVEESIPPAPETMPLALVVEMLPKLNILEDWIKSMRGHVLARLENGEDVPGYKLVAKRPTRRWTNTREAETILRRQEFESEEIMDMDLKSPAQIEKLLGKKPFAALLGEQVVKLSSGHKMAPASDPSPALVVSRGEEFAALMSGEAVPTGKE